MKSIAIKSTLATLAFVLAGSLAPLSVSAAATASYSLSQSGNTVSVYENSTTAVNTVQVNLSYTGTQPVSLTTGSVFGTCISPTTTSIPCSALGGSITATNLVATLTFANATATSQVSVLTSSAIYDSTTNADDLDHTTLPSLSYSYTAAVSAPTGGTTGSTSTTGTTKTGSGSTTTTPATGTTGTSTTGTTGSTSTTGKTTQKPTKHVAVKPTPKHISSRHTGLVTSSISVLVIILAAVYWLVIRKPAEVVPAAAVYKLDTASTKRKPATRSKSSTSKKASSKK